MEGGQTKPPKHTKRWTHPIFIHRALENKNKLDGGQTKPPKHKRDGQNPSSYKKALETNKNLEGGQTKPPKKNNSFRWSLAATTSKKPKEPESTGIHWEIKKTPETETSTRWKHDGNKEDLIYQF